MKTLNILFASSAMILASAASAQVMDDQSADPATAPAQEAPAMDDSAEAATFSDTEVKSFATAVVKLQSLTGDEATKQQQAAQIVADAGIDAETFNAIGTAMQTDPELAQRVQLAAAEVQPDPAG